MSRLLLTSVDRWSHIGVVLVVLFSMPINKHQISQLAFQYLPTHQSPTKSYLYSTSLIGRFWVMGPNTAGQVGCFDNMCLRHILRIPHADDVTNATERLQAVFTAPAVSAHPGQTASIFGHVARTYTSTDITRALKVSIRGLPKDWRRPLGRPRHTWLVARHLGSRSLTS